MRKYNQPQFSKKASHENFIHTVLEMKFYTRVTSGGRTVFRAFVSGVLFFFRRWSIYRPEKNQRIQKSTSAQIGGKSTTDCAGRFSQTVSIDQSVCPTMSFRHRDSQNCAFARFRSPRLFIEAMQFTTCIYYAVGKKHSSIHVYVCVYFAAGWYSVNWIFRLASFDAWLFITRDRYQQVILLLWSMLQIEKEN